jgi:hypothetical protein
MMHRHHLICALAATGLILWFVVAGPAGSPLAGISLALLLCPLTMAVVMWLLMRPSPEQRRRDAEPHHDGHPLPR